MIDHVPHEFSANSQVIHSKRYLDPDAPTIEKLHRRVSGGNEEYFRLMNNAWFMPNSPTLFNMGTKQGGTSSACFVFDIEDALLGDWPNGGLPEPFATSICGTTFKAMSVAKAGGGVGYYLGKIRQEGADVRSTHKRACGPVTVLRWLNGINRLITQGGKRALAQMGILDAHHPDIRKFIHCLSGDTLVSTPTGEVPIRDLVGKRPLVYAVHGRKVFVQKARKVWKTGVRKTIRVHLDKGGPIICTPEHLVMLRTGKYKPAGKLKPGDSLMAFYRSPQRVGRTQRRYWMVGVTGAALSQKSYRLVMEYKEGRPLGSREYVDHIDNDPLNDSPNNLQILDPVANAKKTKESDGFTTKGWSPTPEQTAKRVASRKGYRHSAETRAKMSASATRRLSNHKVVRVEPWETMDVYDMEVPEFDNFVANGIVVHNCKDENPDELSSFNISVSWRNAWLKQVDFEAVGQYKDVNEQTALWNEQCESAWRTGDPGMFFWNTMNAANATPHLGDINATNPCGETPNLSNEPCNLGSISLMKFVKKVGNKFVFMWDLFRATVRTAIRFMDDILDWNTFPHPDIDHMARHTRKLGLGVMGYAATLHLLGMDYDTQDAVDWGAELMSVLNGDALDESRRLAITKGNYPAWDKDKSPAWAVACRNSTRTSIAPTGTIYLLSDAETSGIEPYFALETSRTTGEGMKLTEKVSTIALTGRTPKLANEIGIEWHVKHQAAFQKHTDLGVSKTINLPNSATVKDVSDCYRMMWESGCKGGTIYRDGCRADQVLRATRPKKTSNVYVQMDLPPEEPKRKIMPVERTGTTLKFRVGGTKGYCTANTFEDGTLGEVFITIDKQGSTLAGFLDAFAKTFSLALQNGTPLEDLVRLHANSRFEPAGITGDPIVPNCTSIIDYIVRRLDTKFGSKLPGTPRMEPVITAMKELSAKVHTGQFCSDCGAELIRSGGTCMSCPNPQCGFSKC